MMNLLDLPAEMRAKRLARMGSTEDEYREELKRDAADLEALEAANIPPTNLHHKGG